MSNGQVVTSIALWPADRAAAAALCRTLGVPNRSVLVRQLIHEAARARGLVTTAQGGDHDSDPSQQKAA